MDKSLQQALYGETYEKLPVIILNIMQKWECEDFS